VRLLDPPLHEFLPDHEELIVKQAKGEITDASASCCRGRVLARVEPDARHAWLPARHLKPGLYRMQVRALMQAAVTRKRAVATRSSRS
jgi:pyruvate,orthophosphate dikinase